MIKSDNKNEIKMVNSEAHLTTIYPCIPVIPRVRVAVCRGVPKSTTVPVPAIPVLETLRVFPYPCLTLQSSMEVALIISGDEGMRGGQAKCAWILPNCQS